MSRRRPLCEMGVTHGWRATKVLPALAPATRVDARDQYLRAEKEPPEDCEAEDGSARRPARLQRCSGATCVTERGVGPVSAACQVLGGAGRRVPTVHRGAATLTPAWPGGQGAAAAVCGSDEGDSVDIDSASFGRGVADGGWGTSGSGLVGFFTACLGAQVRLLPENLVIGLFQRWLFHASAPSAGSRWEPATHGAAGVLHHLAAWAYCLAAPPLASHVCPVSHRPVTGKLSQIKYLRRKRGAKDYRGNAGC